MSIRFTDDEIDYLRSQYLGRLATVDRAGAPQNSPVGYVLDEETGRILIGGYSMGKTRKYRNVARNGYAALVVDDLPSIDPWQVRGVEVRGTAEAVSLPEPLTETMTTEVIRIAPRWIASWGLPDGRRGMDTRGVQADATS